MMAKLYKFSKMEIGLFNLKQTKRGYKIASFYVDEKFLILFNLK